MRWQVIVIVVVLAAMLAFDFIPWPIDIDAQTKEIGTALLAGVGVAIGYYAREKRDKSLQNQFANYRCPKCRYFVSRDDTKCPKCGQSITPVAE